MGAFDFVRGLLGGESSSDAGTEQSSTTESSDVDDDPEDLEPPELFEEEAEELAVFWSEWDLDFTPESLQRLDEFVNQQWEKDRFRDIETVDGDDVHMDEMVFQGVSLQLGSYYGETLVRTYEEAAWVNDEDFGWVITVDGPDAELVSNVFHIARDCLREPSKFSVSYGTVATQSGVGEPLESERGDVVRISVTMPDEDTSPSTFQTLAATLVEDYSWFDLDYSPESLAELDDLVVEELFDGGTLVDNFSDEELSETVRKLGSYLGETLTRSYDGEWTFEDPTWVVDIEQDGDVLETNVFRAAVSALHEDTTFVELHSQLTGEAIEADAELAELAATYANMFASAWSDYDLDLSIESIAQLDALAAAEHSELTALEEMTEQMYDTALEFGMYFGTAIEREHEAAWVDQDGPTILLETDDGGSVGVNVVQSAATCLAGNATFEGTYEHILAER